MNNDDPFEKGMKHARTIFTEVEKRMIELHIIGTHEISKHERELLAFAFSEGNKGYKPDVIEAPNGDGHWDTGKRYAHIAPKYGMPKDIQAIYSKMMIEALLLCSQLEIPTAFWPSQDSTIRVLDYPPGATTAPHTDFDLFTLSMYRDDVSAFKYLEGGDDKTLDFARSLRPGVHFGELMAEVMPVQATKHEVIATPHHQLAAVFFAVPNHSAVLPSGVTVGAWLAERLGRSRKTK